MVKVFLVDDHEVVRRGLIDLLGADPALDVVVTSGKPLREPLPAGTKFWPKPWAPLDVLREAQFAQGSVSRLS